MPHAFSLVPNFSVPPAAPPECERGFAPADPIFAAVDRHTQAWAAFQVALDGEPSIDANDEMDAALTALLATACASRTGALCLLRHLRWWLNEEAVQAYAYGDEWGVALAREAELAMLLGEGPRRIPVEVAAAPALPAMPKPVALDARPAMTPSLSRLARVISPAGDVMAALVMIAGGCVLCGLATLL